MTTTPRNLPSNPRILALDDQLDRMRRMAESIARDGQRRQHLAIMAEASERRVHFFGKSR